MKRLILIFIVFSLFVRCASQRSLYERALKEDTIKAYNEFLVKFPKGDLSNKVRELKEQTEYSDFQIAKILNSKQAYFDFLNTHSDSTLTNMAKKAIAQIDYDEAKGKNTIQAYQNFINTNTDSYFNDLARQAIILQIGKTTNPKQAYLDFINTCSDSILVGLVKKTITQINYIEANEKNTIQAYRDFIENTTDTSYISQARNAIINIEYELCKKSNSVDKYKYFLTNYPQNPHSNEIENKLISLEYDTVKQTNAEQAYEQFIEKYPDHKLAKDAQKRLQIAKQYFLLKARDNISNSQEIQIVLKFLSFNTNQSAIELYAKLSPVALNEYEKSVVLSLGQATMNFILNVTDVNAFRSDSLLAQKILESRNEYNSYDSTISPIINLYGRLYREGLMIPSEEKLSIIHNSQRLTMQTISRNNAFRRNTEIFSLAQEIVQNLSLNIPVKLFEIYSSQDLSKRYKNNKDSFKKLITKLDPYNYIQQIESQINQIENK
jgi:hypothetical protein